ncbi:MAG: 50S ribosomal protein L35 [Chitinivibrionales bacterium]|nr:50S ribosomal protein L35 [Chitinivibrionales bacterium]
MPKMKTRSAVKKRFSTTASGKVKHKDAYKSHLLGKKSTKRKRNLRKDDVIENKAQEKRIKRMLGE